MYRGDVGEDEAGKQVVEAMETATDEVSGQSRRATDCANTIQTIFKVA